jgi:DNA repair and recombination protein RAD54B
MEYWKSELTRWNPKARLEIMILDQTLPKRVEIIKNNKFKINFVYITTPHCVFKHVEDFAKHGKIDLLIVDEGHKAKNINTNIRKGIKELYVKRQKIILTGTPVQNNLLEFYSLMDIVEDGVLGTISEFKTEYHAKITKGLKKRDIFTDMFKAKELIIKLKEIYRPYFLRRTKKEIFEVKSAELSSTPLEACQLPLKTDLVI